MPIKYIPYTPNTTEGQAVLDNITRTQRVLRYRDGDKVIAKIQRGMPYYEVEKQEQVGAESENLVIRGECLSACAYLKKEGIKVDLVYIDPPFASGADYAKKVYIRKNPKLAAKVKAAEQELDLEGLKAFEETMYGDIWQKEDYLNWMYENLRAIKSVMSKTSSIYVHLDWHIGHYVKILLDEIFGEENFVNEVIWKYAGARIGKRAFGKKHDTIFIYSLEYDKHIFNYDKVRDPYAESTIKRNKYSNSGSSTRVLDYKPNEDGKFPEDVWDISIINPFAKERLDYATQKPEALLQRILKASSDAGMVVADFFGGSGVTAKVAHDLGRKFIHCDVGINSIQTVRDRLTAAGAAFQIMEIQDGVSLFRNPQQTMDKLAKLIPGLQQDVPGLSKFWFGTLQDSKAGTVPVYVPNLIDHTEKVLDIPTVNRVINQELQNLDFNAEKAVIYYVDIDDEAEVKKFIKDNNPTITKIELRDLKALLHDIVIEDEIEVKVTAVEDKYRTEVLRFFSDRLQRKIDEFNEKGNLQAVNKGKKFTPIDISEAGLELIEFISLDCENTEGVWHSSTEIKIDKTGYLITDGQKSKEFWDGTVTSEKKPKRLKVRNISGDESVITI